MPYPFQALIIATALLCAPAASAANTAPEPETNRIIAELGLREGAAPLSENPRWQPRRIVVSLPDRLSARQPGLEQRLTKAAGEVEIIFDRSADFSIDPELMKDADGVIGFCNPVTLNNAGDRLLWFHNYTAGIEACTALPESQLEGRLFSNSKRLHGPAIGEHTIAMMMSLARGLPIFIRADSWDRAPASKVTFGEVRGKRMLVVGLGGIGSQIAWRAHGLGMKVSAVRNSSREGPDYIDHVGLPEELFALAAQADVIVNALPLTKKTTGLFDRAFFDALKPGALFLSVGRGKSTVTADLIHALNSGKLAGAGLDVTDPEPLPADSPLWKMDNVIITPHMSATGQGSTNRVAAIVVENLRRYVAGERLLNVVDMQAGY